MTFSDALQYFLLNILHKWSYPSTVVIDFLYVHVQIQITYYNASLLNLWVLLSASYNLGFILIDIVLTGTIITTHRGSFWGTSWKVVVAPDIKLEKSDGHTGFKQIHLKKSPNITVYRPLITKKWRKIVFLWRYFVLLCWWVLKTPLCVISIRDESMWLNVIITVRNNDTFTKLKTPINNNDTKLYHTCLPILHMNNRRN